MKPGFLVEWLEQAVQGAVAKHRAEQELQRPRRQTWPTAADLEAVARAMGFSDPTALRGATDRTIRLFATCKNNHRFQVDLREESIWGEPHPTRARKVVEQIKCRACDS